MRRFVQAFGIEDALPTQLDPPLRAALAAYPDHYNLGKGDLATAIVCHDGVARVQRLRWGIVPRWSKTPDTPYTTITARLERAARSRIFAAPWKSQHCLIPLSGYYKWDRSRKPAQPYYIHHAQGEVLLAAGLWERWERGEPALLSFSVLTHANPAIPAPLTADGPIFLSGNRWRSWLRGPRLFPTAFLVRAPQPTLTAYPVSSAYRQRERNDYTLLEPVDSAAAWPDDGADAEEDEDDGRA
ncbi:SOS response-associated peptidase [Xanthomonas graminis]|uniref:SOS response-associated peptidase n=1 Tax=Xanthomonas graminis TaxID=3390026 RepID=UPI001F2801FA|nr:SOS response-associated peptidase family protein [Xanthomonas translucens]UKE73906.1 SOS response-associated peptidase [Xanthomonas translucens pv. phleipratensis]